MENILTLIVPIFVGFIALKFFMSQVGCLWKILVNSLSGFACLWLLNLLSGITGIVFEINFFTALVVGLLGIPGILLLTIAQII